MIHTVLEVPFLLTGPYVITADGVSKTIHNASTSVTTWYRMVFAKSSAAGTEDDPKSMLSHFNSVVGAPFQLNVGEDSKFTLKRNTASGDNTGIVWNASAQGLKLRDRLGFTGNSTNPGVGVTVSATYLPAFRIASGARVGDTTPLPKFDGGVYSRAQNGRVYGRGGQVVLVDRTCTFSHHARDVTAQAIFTNLESLPALSTPCYPPKSVDMRTGAYEPAYDASPNVPYTVLEFVLAARARRLAITFGKFQEIRAMTFPYFDIASLDVQTAQGSKTSFALVQERFDPLYKFTLGFSIEKSNASF